MKIQELAIIFIIIILPISLLLSEYTQFQIQTIKLQTEYDARLTSATYDAIRAFQLNTFNSTTSDMANSKMRDLEASVNTFRNSIMSGFELNGYTEDDLNNYIPALVYTLYNGFYIYSPYENINYRYETDESGNKNPIDDNGDTLYGIKPYISYSCRYVNGDTDVVITYSLDNYVTIQGTMFDPDTSKIEYVNKSGYLIDNISIDGDNVIYNGVTIQKEQLKDNVGGNTYNYAKINGTKYYYIDNYLKEEDVDGNTIIKDCIVYILNGTPIVQYEEGDAQFVSWKNTILDNESAIQYYKDAKEFTDWFKNTDLKNLKYEHAIDEVIIEYGDNKGEAIMTNMWPGDDKVIFDFNTLGGATSNNIENELSEFNQHRLAIIRHKIETNLAIAISNYNSYSGATHNVFQMPELKEDEWEQLTHNISLISFLQGLPIGGKIYNGYSIVTNSESKEVVQEESIYILGKDTTNDKYNYHKIGDRGLEDGSISVDAGNYEGSSDGSGKIISAGRLNLDFEKTTLINSENTASIYYYPLRDYNASYDSIVMQNNVTTYDDIYEYVNGQSTELKTAFYTALGRERASQYKSENIVNIEAEPTYIPEGYEHVEGTTMETGYVIEDRKGNQFVWVEVPKNTTVYRETTLALDLDTLTGEDLTNACTEISNDLYNYIRLYRSTPDGTETVSTDSYNPEFGQKTGLGEVEYYKLKNKMIKSIFKNEGFYVGRYETGIEDKNTGVNEYRTAGGNTTETAVIKQNAYPYNWVTTVQAQELAENFASTGYVSSLMFGLQWDLVMKYLQSKGINSNDLMKDENDLGNYYRSTYTITNTDTQYSTNNGRTWNFVDETYEKIGAGETLLTTGASDAFTQQNISDLGGNLWEMTLENSNNTSYPIVVRGSTANGTTSSAGYMPAARGRYSGSAYWSGFRVALYTDEEVNSEGRVSTGLIREFDAKNNTGTGHNSSATNWKDLKGNADGTLNGATWSSDYLSLDGVDDWVNLGEISTDAPITIETTITINSLPGDSAIIIANVNNGGVEHYINKNGYLCWAVWDAENSEYVRIISDVKANIGQKYHIIGTFDGTILELYIDGELVATKEFTGTYGAPTNNTVMAIGVNPKGNGVDTNREWTNMNVYSARIYNRVLTEEEINQNFKASK